MFQKKDLPSPSFRLVLEPASDTEYRHFEAARDVPFDVSSTGLSRQNAWWLADASLLSYWDATAARQRFLDAGLTCVPISGNGTQCYVAWTATFALVAFRGTEPDSIHDILTDARLRLTSWDTAPEQVHEGFKDGLNAVWPDVVGVLTAHVLPVWFTGHSLGAALATLAADRFVRERQARSLADLGGVYTFGSPLVGDRRFVDGFNARVGDRSFRFVNDEDAVARVPPPLFGYRHVNTEHFVGAADPEMSLSEPLIDHTPRRYAVLAWNAFVDAVGPAAG